MNPISPSTPLTPRHAATVILLRQAAEVEVLVIRRHENLAFMGGMWVFPGGALAPADASPEALACIPPSSQSRCRSFLTLQGSALTHTQRLGLTVAAYRETFEETGVLLARQRDGASVGREQFTALQAQRAAIAKDAALFPAALRSFDLVLDIDRLLYWAHWITPSNAPRRFDTRFFIAAAPPEQTARIDATEAVDHAWMTPRALLESAERNAMPVSQPTLYNLMELDASLARSRSLDGLLSDERERAIAPILPKVMRESGTLIVMPWDPEYAALPGEGAPPATAYPEHLRALPSRLYAK